MKKAFTLIEILIVTVIIGILASALIPRLSGAQERAKNARLIKETNDIVTALDIYYMDYNSYPISATCSGTVKTDCTLSGVKNQFGDSLTSIPASNNGDGPWTIGNGYMIPSGKDYGYVGLGDRYILSYIFTDSRDGQKYKAVRMPDKKRWMAENLNYKTDDSYCYNDIEANCGPLSGRFYSLISKKTACPVGWHLPTYSEWTIMLNAVETLLGGITNHDRYNTGNGSKANKALMDAKYGYGTDSFGFSVRLMGWRYVYNLRYQTLNNVGSFWLDDKRSWVRAFYTYYNTIYTSHLLDSKLSVRCIRD